MKKSLIFVVILFLITNCGFEASKKVYRVSSPDSNIVVSLIQKKDNLYYYVSYAGKPVIHESLLGIKFKNFADFSGDLTINSIERDSANEEWEQPWGESKVIRNHFNEISVSCTKNSDVELNFRVIFRVFDDGIGFRYQFPEQEHLSYCEITDELTQFNIHPGDSLWWIESYKEQRYEQLYERTIADSAATYMHTPLTIEKENGLFAVIHEADLENFSSMSIKNNSGGKMEADLAPWSNDSVRVRISVPFETPWRTITISDHPGGLIESNIILNLNEPCKIEDVSWIKPIKYIGIWWGMHINEWTFGEGPMHGATTERAKEYIDFAAANGFAEVLIEGWNKGWKTGEGWHLDDGSDVSFVTPTDDYDLVEVDAYADSKNVHIMGYHETMANTKNYLSQIDSAFSLMKKLGYRSVKIGQVGTKLDKKEWHYGQYGVEYYRNVLKKAAEYELMVNFHEPIKPTGERRTYPNMMTREGARGMEYNAWDGAGGNPPGHTVILPFTRLLAGPMDFTPGIFNLTLPTRSQNQVNTTLAKQLALYVVIYSPVQMASDMIENYQDQPAFKFIKDVPVDWEKSLVIDAKIGDYLIIARKDKHSNDWYLGAITDEYARTFTIQADFLDSHTPYKAEIYKDASVSDFKDNPTAIEISAMEVSANERISLHLARGGGAAIRFIAK